MSIRLWLMLADCWRCGTSLELTEEQEREARKLLDEQRRQSAADLAVSIPPREIPRPQVPASPPASKKPWRDSPAARPAPPSKAPTPKSAPQPIDLRRMVRGWGRQIFRDLPAWLISLVVHLVVLLLLGLWTAAPSVSKDRELVLSTRIGPEDEAGGLVDAAMSDDPLEFADPGDLDPQKVDTNEVFSPREAAAITEMPFNPIGDLGELKRPDLPVDLPFNPIPSAGGEGSLFSGRDPTARATLVENQGGTIASEAAVARGLEWLARHQNSDGSWSLHEFHSAGGCKGRCSIPGVSCDTAGTALGLLPFLGAGQTPQKGEYAQTVKKAIAWLVEHQKANGDLWTGGYANTQLYAHGQAAIALSEAHALTRDPKLEKPAQAALDFIVKAQHEAGGWRYFPGQEGDTSVVGWQIMALRSGRMGYLKVPQETFDAAGRFLDSVQKDTSGGQYGYQAFAVASPAMTAEALLCRQYAGWERNHTGLQEGVRYLLKENPPNRRDSNMYYWYYGTQVMHHMGGETWKEWNDQMRELLVETQETEGHAAGSWTPVGGHDIFGGRLYMTALATCTLEVYYRHLPLYQETAVRKD